MRGSNEEGATPYCRCRVLYLGSSVPHASKEGLLGVQEPLRELYPEQGALGARGIDSWLSVWSNGLLLENVDEHRKKVTRFFPIEALHYCAAVRHVKGGTGGDSSTTTGGGGATTRFLPLDSPFARTPSANHPPLFAAVLRRTTGIKVLECHAFICKRDMAANALVRCCFHAYADSSYAKGLDPSTITSSSSTSNGATAAPINGGLYHTLGGSSLDNNNESSSPPLEPRSNEELASLCNGDENHKVWAKGRDEVDTVYQEQGTLRSTRGSRPRQLVAPPPPPPPPPPPQSLLGEDSSATRRKATANKKIKKPKNRTEETFQQHPHHHGIAPQAIYTNGSHHTLAHPTRQQQQQQQQQQLYHQAPPTSGSRSLAGTLARPTPVLLVPAATLPRKAHHHHHHHHHPSRGIVPAAAPIIPIYAPLPVVPPPPPPSNALYQAGGYGTAGNRGRRSHQGILEPVDSSGLGASRRLTASHADLTATDPDNQLQETESRFGTGIYRRKGHLNERAFSYSIRAEHRSRSHGSLASLGFSPAQNGAGCGGGGPAAIPKEEKKDREIAQLVAGLNLDEQERPRHPPGAYPRPNPHHHHHHHHQQMQQPQPLPRPRPR